MRGLEDLRTGSLQNTSNTTAATMQQSQSSMKKAGLSPARQAVFVIQPWIYVVPFSDKAIAYCQNRDRKNLTKT